MRTGWIVVAALGAAWATKACGGNDELFRSGTAPPPAGTGAAGTTTSPTGTGTASDTTTSTASGTATGSGGSAGAGGGGGGPSPEIPCTTDLCTDGEVCCVSYQGASNDHCSAPDGCNGEEVEAACDGPDDCPPGDVCCGRFITQGGGTGYYREVLCAPSCEPDASSSGILMCESAADCGGTECVPSGWLPEGFSYCSEG